jgi:small nuclear ribonucleoprotein (snRNP)-like protein
MAPEPTQLIGGVMRIVFILLSLMTMGLFPAVAETSPQCTTNLQIKTCGDTAVVDRKVKIETRDGEKLKKRTDDQGNITLDLCQEEILKIKVSGVDTNKVSSSTSIDATDTEVLATIILNICRG